MNHECNKIMTDDFIYKHISEDKNLIEKYNKFKKRVEIIKDKNKKLCPNPDLIVIYKNHQYQNMSNVKMVINIVLIVYVLLMEINHVIMNQKINL